MRAARRNALLVLSLAALITACAGVRRDEGTPPEAGILISPDTLLGGSSLAWSEHHGGLSGFVGLGDGIDALAARLRLIEQAEVSIDAQYFLIKRDEAAALFVGKLLRAADRGVRVRLLIDDIFTPGLDSELALFSAHPNVEVRLFNPVSRRGLKFWNYLTDFQRANRRMHNKSFTVDDAITIVGGRNIADEYFQIQQVVEFLDFEMLGIGPVAQEVGATFDLFWNSEFAVPVAQLGLEVDRRELDTWREVMAAAIEGEQPSSYQRAMQAPFLRDIRTGQVDVYPASSEVVTDSPAKLGHAVGDQRHQRLANEVTRRALGAQRELILITPYYVPGDAGVAVLETLRARDVRVVLITNSLASTNHVAVHSGYARYRKRLLRAGVEIYELRHDISAVVDGERPPQTLHSKAILIDGQTLFIGSLNLDPRSIDINTEMGVFIESQAASGEIREAVLASIGAVSYRPVLTARGDLRWVYRWGPHLEVLEVEPQTSGGRRFSAGLYGILPIEGQL